MGDTKNVLRDTGNEDDMNLEEVARDLHAREVSGPINTRTLAGVAAMLSEAAENLSCTAESRFVGASCRKR